MLISTSGHFAAGSAWQRRLETSDGVLGLSGLFMKRSMLAVLEMRLAALARMRQPTFYCSRVLPAGLLVSTDSGQALGIWRHTETGLHFTQLGSAEPTHWVESVDAAVILTDSLLALT